MIAQLLNREFVLEQLSTINKQLDSDVNSDRRGGVAGTEHLAPDDYKEALAAVQQTAKREEVVSSGQPSFEDESGRRAGEEPAPLDDFSFFSRDPTISLLQSALDRYFEEHPPEKDEEEVVAREVSDDRRSDGEEVAVTDVSLKGVEPSRSEEGRRLFDKFSITDAGWVSCLIAEGIRKFRKKHDFNTTPNSVKLAPRSRLIMVGDWGSGLPRAQKIAEKMREAIDEGKNQNREVHVFHLGDVYYSGWRREYEKRFLKYWPVRPNEADVYSWSLNANHDMYSGGHDYYDTLLADGRFEKQKRCSFFEIYNDDWRLLGLDTGWDEGDLKDPQAAWVHERINTSDAKVMLLSHHQLFSAYESADEKLERKLRGVLETNRIRSWYWGHEHRCMLYKPHQRVEYARCVGHAGVPVYMSHGVEDPCAEPGEYEYRGSFVKGIERWALMGFAVLDVDGPSVHAQYINEYGNPHKEETFV